MADTEIQWATKVWNFVRGCRRVSSGCGGANGQGGCYAEKTAYRFSGPGMPYEGLVRLGKHGPQWTGKGRFVAEKLAEPLSWRAPRDGSRHRIFVNSMSDLFFDEFSNEEIAAGFGVMAACPQHDFLILTKRPERAAEWFKWVSKGNQESGPLHVSLCDAMHGQGDWDPDDEICEELLSNASEWPLPNVWLGASVEDQKTADDRLSELLCIPAAVRFASYEPALGPVSFWAFLKGEHRDKSLEALKSPSMAGLDWVIVGGESGPGARPFDIAWARSVVEQCGAAGVPAFVKQLGAKAVDSSLRDVFGYGYVHYTGTEQDPRVVEAAKRHDYRVVPHDVSRLHVRDRRKGGDMSEWEPGLRVRQFPERP